MTEPSSPDDPADAWSPQPQSSPNTTGVRVNSPHVVPQGKAGQSQPDPVDDETRPLQPVPPTPEGAGHPEQAQQPEDPEGPSGLDDLTHVRPESLSHLAAQSPQPAEEMTYYEDATRVRPEEPTAPVAPVPAAAAAPPAAPFTSPAPAEPQAPHDSAPQAPMPNSEPTAPAPAPQEPSASEDVLADVGTGSTAQDTGSSNRTRNLIACCGCFLLVLALIISGVLGYLWLKPEESTYERPTTPTAQPTEEEPPEEEPTEEETTEEEVSPAPTDAITLNSLVSPSGNIHCILEGDDVACSMKDHSLESATGGECSNDAPFVVGVGAEGEPQLNCGENVGYPSAAELPYGSSAKNGNVACTSESTGMTCWNTRTGKGFTIAKKTYETF